MSLVQLCVCDAGGRRDRAVPMGTLEQVWRTGKVSLPGPTEDRGRREKYNTAQLCQLTGNSGSVI